MKNKDRIAELEDRVEALEELILDLPGDEDEDFGEDE